LVNNLKQKVIGTKLLIDLQNQQQKSSNLDEQLKEYIAEWRKQRGKEEDDLKKLKDKQAKRKVQFFCLVLCGSIFYQFNHFCVGHPRR
jgi:hypothetical protein